LKLILRRHPSSDDVLNARSILRTCVECAKFALEERISKFSQSTNVDKLSRNAVQKRADLVLRHINLPDESKKDLLNAFHYPIKPNFPLSLYVDSNPVYCTIERIKLTKPLIKGFPARLLGTLIVYNCPMNVRQNFRIMLVPIEMKDSNQIVSLNINSEFWDVEREGQNGTKVCVDLVVPKDFCPSELKVVMQFEDYEPWCCLDSTLISVE